MISLGRVFAGLCLLSSPAVGATTPTDARGGYDAAIKRLESVMQKSHVSERDLKALYTANAVYVESDGRVMSGAAEIARMTRGYLRTIRVTSFEVDTKTFRSDGRIAYGGGLVHIAQVDRRGRRNRHTEQFLVVYRRQPDGNWLLDYGMEAPNPAP